MPLKPAFDLHCHPSLKAPLTRRDVEEVTFTPFDTLEIHVLANIDECEGDPLDSQSSVEQLLNGGINLVVNAFYGLENAYVWSKIIKNVERFSQDLSKDLIKDVRSQNLSYNDLIKREIAFLTKFSDTAQAETNYRYKVIDNINQYDPNDHQTLHILLALEGSHGLFNNPHVGEQDFEAIIQNLRFFKTLGNPRLLYLTPVHHAQMSYMNHAFAIPNQWAGNGNGRDGAGGFNPIREAMNEQGERLIREALSDANNLRRILIDVKHLSLGARLRFYKIHAEEFPEVPIIASHVGFTGVSFNNQSIINRVFAFGNSCYKVRYNRVTAFDQVFFNTWSINFFDEEIAIILKSKGLIGISLDKRILGCELSPINTEERVGKLDLLPAIQKYLNANGEDEEEIPIPDGILPSLDHTLFFCSHIIHAVRIGLSIPEVGEKVWQHLCIGSDYDGLITALNSSKTAEKIPDFRVDILQKLPIVAQKRGVPLPTNLEKAIDQIFYENAFQFLKIHFT